MSVVRYTKEELKKIEDAAKEFMKPDGMVQWTKLFEKYSFPGRDNLNIRVKYKSLQKKQKRLEALAAAESKVNSSKGSKAGSSKESNGVKGRTGFERFASETAAKLKKDEPKLDKEGRDSKIKKMWGSLSNAKKATYNKPASNKRKNQSSSSRSKKKQKREELKLYAQAAAIGNNLPVKRIKKMIKNTTQTDCTKEALTVVGKATEMFILWLAEKSSKIAGTQTKLNINHLVIASKCQEEARFLRVALFNDHVPQSMKKSS
mmetsp:Transcript_21488/g.38111  ORF Transcript_21488/g.38111 Transcript_21488/m.38111 type:complete len:261 (-) Transcript_21488:117-899(-)|eukprot:CAMPEP_0197537570 /NCGR_PEP_ID=MMETSP1318-20131121/57235_1 /TAXON_ID=552666 /ORGANISM="Partenskyella glossopodia, Strain RCC365" /LENGTH=260 /DNA_ID=CAMNT_0043095761 /DNA_START=327 /DNA_END=1109 /DNA_ORIENTATION=-